MMGDGGDWPNHYVRAYEEWTDWMVEEGFDSAEIYNARNATSNIHLACLSDRGGMALRMLTDTDTLLWNTDMRRKLRDLLAVELAKSESGAKFKTMTVSRTAKVELSRGRLEIGRAEP